MNDVTTNNEGTAMETMGTMGTIEPQVACIISNSGIVNISINGKPYSIGTDHPNYSKVLDAIRNGNKTALVNLVDIPKAVSTFTDGALGIVDGEVVYEGVTLHNAIAQRILGLMADDMPFKFMVNFLGNLMQNPSYRAVNELYDFLEFANIPITDDGCFLAYKRVRENYMDIHTGTILNKVGCRPKMLRNMVDEDKNRTCSSGFHFCSLNYIPNFGGNQENSTDHVMIVKIDPKDVVAIPADYNNTKGRCCEYLVVAEYEGDWRVDAFTKSVHSKDGTPFEPNAEEYAEEYDEVETCPDCGADMDGGECSEGCDEDEICPDCGWEMDNGICNNSDCGLEPEDEPEDEPATFGTKPNGQRFYSVRNASGQFVKKGGNA